MVKLSLFALAAFAPTASNAFAPSAGITNSAIFTHDAIIRQEHILFAESDSDATESAFVPLEGESTSDDSFDKVESFGKGAAKAKRGKRKGSTAPSASKAAASLTPEETFYEGPPAITETIAPTVSILTVVGIIPAAAAWARQAWVRYKITSRRIRVNSGIGGKEMAEIVYPDIIEIRTVKRLFGDGDMVAFLRDGAKFEMRNIPNFAEAMEFILKQVDADVAAAYRNKGDVTRE
mmetsp:Transcript_144/g.149  ORF Transcript_144/g.149 Transcript_144/m.149 type:complete len:235 (-) Transcript_144:190-894(-)|eukprot:CAMPEP_0197834208 /NCGR_PEP_ID=MMETSP1437-20131217/21621_1 /TAXON_ID=49252 ORGANISM="Eucampia antarctica, Strain CCMP1452" /NCGR_SAMPLE_ID=MMETSP1437 /ASSEMBLY_ACC=CAM_ASM_001096 /LENGTH=234 /DNA_ID=CAMNT_0043438733 /DNA_START=61 /DNA_END=765 /DNA_ORIENTATION=+